jgi:hypothetical protein
MAEHGKRPGTPVPTAPDYGERTGRYRSSALPARFVVRFRLPPLFAQFAVNQPVLEQARQVGGFTFIAGAAAAEVICFLGTGGQPRVKLLVRRPRGALPERDTKLAIPSAADADGCPLSDLLDRFPCRGMALLAFSVAARIKAWALRTSARRGGEDRPAVRSHEFRPGHSVRGLHATTLAGQLVRCGRAKRDPAQRFFFRKHVFAAVEPARSKHEFVPGARGVNCSLQVCAHRNGADTAGG